MSTEPTQSREANIPSVSSKIEGALPLRESLIPVQACLGKKERRAFLRETLASAEIEWNKDDARLFLKTELPPRDFNAVVQLFARESVYFTGMLDSAASIGGSEQVYRLLDAELLPSKLQEQILEDIKDKDYVIAPDDEDYDSLMYLSKAEQISSPTILIEAYQKLHPRTLVTGNLVKEWIKGKQLPLEVVRRNHVASLPSSLEPNQVQAAFEAELTAPEVIKPLTVACRLAEEMIGSRLNAARQSGISPVLFPKIAEGKRAPLKDEYKKLMEAAGIKPTTEVMNAWKLGTEQIPPRNEADLMEILTPKQRPHGSTYVSPLMVAAREAAERGENVKEVVRARVEKIMDRAKRLNKR